MKKLCLSMGFFDSVHIGHRALLNESRVYAERNGLIPAVYTFKNDMGELLGGKQLYDFAVREKLLSEYAEVISDVFDKRMMELSGEQFISEIIKKHNVGAFFCGYDYSFGARASCRAEDLRSISAKYGIDCVIVPKQTLGGEKVSTSRIKELLIGGEVELANKLLIRPYHMTGEVVHGRGVGTIFGIPTANIEYDGFLPKPGVYKTSIDVDGTEFIAVTNVGAKPTFGIDSVGVESMLIDFDGDLYGKTITINYKKYLRGIYKFESGEELRDRIAKDIKEATCSE